MNILASTWGFRRPRLHANAVCVSLLSHSIAVGADHLAVEGSSNTDGVSARIEESFLQLHADE